MKVEMKHHNKKSNVEEVNLKLIKKIEDNILMFDQLETELIKKDEIINSQNDIITNQKREIERLIVITFFIIYYRNTLIQFHLQIIN